MSANQQDLDLALQELTGLVGLVAESVSRLASDFDALEAKLAEQSEVDLSAEVSAVQASIRALQAIKVQSDSANDEAPAEEEAAVEETETEAVEEEAAEDEALEAETEAEAAVDEPPVE